MTVEEPIPAPGLARRALRGTAAGAIAYGLATVTGVASSILLARLLPPEAFGAFALVLAVDALLGRVRDQALVPAGVQHPQGGDSVYTAQLVLGLAAWSVYVLVLLAAGPILAMKLGRDTLLMLWVLAAATLAQVVAAPLSTRVERTLQGRGLAAAGAVPPITAALISVGLAWTRPAWGAWCLVAGYATSFLTLPASLYLLLGWRPRWVWDREVVTGMARFLAALWLLAGLTTLIFHTDNLLVGLLAGDRSLGFYAKAFSFAAFPTTFLLGFMGRPAYATYARLREDPAGLGRAFELVSYAHARLGGLAAVLALALAGPVLIPLIGEKWWPMIPILQSLAPYMALRGLLDNAAVLVVTQGRPREETKARMLQLAIMVLAIPPLVLWQGAQGAALGLDLATVAACVYLCRRVRGQVNIAWIPLVLPPVLALLAGGTAALGVANLTASRGLASQGAASAAAGLAAYALVLLALERGKPLRELRYLWERLR